jgi:hypothetical protein
LKRKNERKGKKRKVKKEVNKEKSVIFITTFEPILTG